MKTRDGRVEGPAELAARMDRIGDLFTAVYKFILIDTTNEDVVAMADKEADLLQEALEYAEDISIDDLPAEDRPVLCIYERKMIVDV